MTYFEKSKVVFMPDVEECVSVFQTALNRGCDRELREKLPHCDGFGFFFPLPRSG